jgi:hypothetical protein
VASSSTKNLFFLSKALARQSNCFWPAENISEILVISDFNLSGN